MSGGRIDKHGLGTPFLKCDIDCTTYCTSSMHGARGYNRTLPFGKLKVAPTRKLDLQLARLHQEQFVRVRVIVPAILAFEHGKSHAVAIDINQYLIAISFRYCSLL